MASLESSGPAGWNDGSDLRIAIVHARWNLPIVEALVKGCLKSLKWTGVRDENIVIERVPGSYELPFAAQCMSKYTSLDAIIAIGVLIKGATMHFEYIADAVSHGLMKVQLDSSVPVIFGLLTVLTEEQALARAGIGGEGVRNHGEDWGKAAVELGVSHSRWKIGDIDTMDEEV